MAPGTKPIRMIRQQARRRDVYCTDTSPRWIDLNARIGGRSFKPYHEKTAED
jgi:hypothetical protein